MDRSRISNLFLYTILAVMRGLAGSVAIVLWVVFLQRHYGFSLTEVVLLDIPFWVGKFLFEIPTGVVADRFGRKLSLAISSGMSSVIWLIFSFVGSFPLLMVAQLIGALAATFSSGADEALLYESVRAVGREQEFAKIFGRMRAIEMIVAMISGVGVGYLAAYNLVLPVILASVILALQLIPILLMKETAKLNREEGSAHDPYWHTVRHALGILRHHPILRWAAAYLVVLGCVSFYSSIFLQPITLAFGLTLAAIGPVTVVIQLLGIAGAASVGSVQKKIGNSNLLFVAPLLIIPGLASAGIIRLVSGAGQTGVFPYVLGSLGLSAFLFSLTQPVLLSVLQSRVSNEARATLLSIQSLLSTIFLILTEPGLGVIADRLGIHFAYIAMAAMTAAVMIPLLWWGRNWFNGKNSELREI